MSQNDGVPKLMSIKKVSGSPRPPHASIPSGDSPAVDRRISLSSPDISSSLDDPSRKGRRFRVKSRKRSEVSSSPCSPGQSQVQVNGFLSQPELRAHRSQNIETQMSVQLLNVPDANAGPADDLWTTRSDGRVRLRMETSGLAAEAPRTVHSFFAATVRRFPRQPALAFKKDPKAKGFTTISYGDYYRMVVNAGKSFVKLGLEPNYSVGIIGFNSVEWFIADLGAIFAGGFACGIYTTNSPETCQFVASNAEAQIIVAEDATQVKKILGIQKQLPKLKAIVQWKGELAEKNHPMLMTWAAFMEVGKDEPDSLLEARLRPQVPNQCCTLIYTSGTTGNPKGVMLSHDNLTWTALATSRYAQLIPVKEAVISYLPLSHVAAQVVDVFGMMAVGGTVYFAQPDALKGSLGATLKEVRPTVFLGVPRVWEKMQERLMEAGRMLSPSKRKLGAWAKGVGLRGGRSRMRGRRVPMGWALAHLLVFKRLKRTLGLDRCRFCVTAAAPIAKETLDYFMSLTLPLMEVYGMSESTGPHTVSLPTAFRSTAVGKGLPGVRTRLHAPDKDGNGEVCMAGRNVFMGYLREDAKTRETIDEDGWLRSGDVGRFDEDDFLYITGRIKEILITAGGENVAPVPVEDRVKEALPFVSNAMLIGDKRKFLSVMLTAKCELGEEGESLESLAPATKEWLRGIGCGQDVATVSDLCRLSERRDSPVAKAITEGIEKANEESVSRACRIQKWKMLPKDFTLVGGELGPTMKLRRPIVTKMYATTIDSLYAD